MSDAPIETPADDELPEQMRIRRDKRDRILAEGRQAYWVCPLVAESETHEIVGSREVTVPAHPEGSTRERTTLQTTSRPLVGNVTGCWYPED